MLDFYAPQYGLGIEADGGEHYTNRGKEKDETRARELFKRGVELLRFNDHVILTNIEGVCEVIEKTLKRKRDTPSPPSSPPWGEDARNRK